MIEELSEANPWRRPLREGKESKRIRHLDNPAAHGYYNARCDCYLWTGLNSPVQRTWERSAEENLPLSALARESQALKRSCSVN